MVEEQEAQEGVERRRLRIGLVDVPTGAPGIYANFANVSHSPYEMTLDFAIVVPGADLPSAEELTKTGILPATLVARVRIPLRTAQGLVDALTSQIQMMQAQEAFTGTIGEEELDDATDES